MKALITSDVHLTDRDRDEYRWKTMAWVADQCTHNIVDELVICGDLTDEKDKHSSVLVNRLVEQLHAIVESGVQVRILIGNHDYIEKTQPFFSFLKLMGGVSVYDKPADVGTARYLPHSRKPLEEWKFKTWRKSGVLFCHQTFDGAKVSADYEMKNELSNIFFTEKGFNGIAISGDVHVPQRCGDIVYCGSPHPVTFGDSFTPRVLLLDGSSLTSIKVPTIRRWTLDIYGANELRDTPGLQKGHQAKVRVHLRRRDFPSWERIKDEVEEAADEMGLQLFSLEMHERRTRKRILMEDKTAKADPRRAPVEQLKEFADVRGYEEGVKSRGLEILEGVG